MAFLAWLCSAFLKTVRVVFMMFSDFMCFSDQDVQLCINDIASNDPELASSYLSAFTNSRGINLLVR